MFEYIVNYVILIGYIHDMKLLHLPFNISTAPSGWLEENALALNLSMVKFTFFI